MMTNWVRHFVEDRLDWMADHSFKNCHTLGVDSILFDNTRGREIRLFVAHENHDLHSNSPYNIGDSAMSVGYHSHHCDITLHVVQGRLLNINADLGRDGPLYDAFAFSSAIKGEGRFEQVSSGHQLNTLTTLLLTGDSLDLPAAQLHTVCVDKGRVAAWFVYEGKEDPAYQALTYSDADLTTWTKENLYLPVTKSYVCQVLEKVGIL